MTENPIVPEVVSLRSLSAGFPALAFPSILRDNIIGLFENIFAAGIDLVAIEGMEGGGKTTTAAQFVERHSETAISLFLQNGGWGTDLETHRRDLAGQIYWLLHQKELPVSSVDSAAYRQLLGQLQTRARRFRETYYFVIDGLDDIPPQLSSLRESLLAELAPFGYGPFRYLLTGDLANHQPHLPHGLRAKYHSLPLFSFDETSRYLMDLRLDEYQLRSIQKHSGGAPLFLATLRRILSSGRTLSEVLEGTATELADLFAVEWHKAKPADAPTTLAIAIIAHDQYLHTIGDLASLVTIDTGDLQTAFAKLAFVKIDGDGAISFISEAYKRFVASALSAHRENVFTILIDHLSRTPGSPDAILRLPHQYNEVHRYSELLAHLSFEALVQIVQSTHSLDRLREYSGLGYRAAKTINNFPDIVRFALVDSFTKDLSASELDRSEIRALVPLGRYEDALRVAESASLVEDRLHLLSVVARSCKESGHPMSLELLQRIRDLADQIDARAHRDRALRIASDLVFADVDLAVKLLERAADVGPSANSLDMALVQLSIAANVHGDGPKMEALHDRIQDPALRSFVETAASAVGDSSADKVLAQANTIVEPGARVFLLRLWCKRNKKRSDALDVVGNAIRFTIAATKYAPNATVFLDLAQPLIYGDNADRQKELIAIFDSQRASVQNLGPTEDHVKLQLTLAKAEKKLDEVGVRSRMTDLYLYVADLPDLATRANGAAMFVTELSDLDRDRDLERSDGLHSLGESLLTDALEGLRNRTARHDEVFQGVLATLAPDRLLQAFEIAGSLNTEERRDLAYRTIVRAHMRGDATTVSLPTIVKAIDATIDSTIRSDEIAFCLRGLNRRDVQSPEITAMLPSVLALVDKVTAYNQRAECRSYAYVLAKKYLAAEAPVLAEHLIRTLRGEIEQIDREWERVDCGFGVARRLAAVDSKVAATFLDEADRLRQSLTVSGEESAARQGVVIRLAIRAWSGMLERRVDRPEDIGLFEGVIDALPSDGERILLWSEVAVSLYRAERQQECRRIVGERIEPLLARLRERDPGRWMVALQGGSAALFGALGHRCVEAIRCLPMPQRDSALYGVVRFICCRQSPSEPYDSRARNGYDIGHQDILDVITVAESLSTDGKVFLVVRDVARTVLGQKRRFSRQQDAETARRLTLLVNNKLPDANNIRHEGFKLAAEAWIAAVLRADRAMFKNIVDRVAGIENDADRGYALCLVASAVPSSLSTFRDEIMRDAIEAINTIPSDLDRAGRLSDLGEQVMQMDKALARQCLQAAMTAANKSRSSNPAVNQRRLDMVDCAYRIDPEFASTLASLNDDDPARDDQKEAANDRLLINKVKGCLVNGDMDGVSRSDRDDKNVLSVAHGAWLALGALNAGRAGAMRPDEIVSGIDIAARGAIGTSYPMFAWIVANVVEKYRLTEQSSSIVRPMFDGMMGVARLAANIVGPRMAAEKKLSSRFVPPAPGVSRLIVHDGERSAGIEFIKKWCRERARTYVKIADPFFGPQELEIVKLLQEEQRELSFYILTSRKHQEECALVKPWEDAYRERWSGLSDADPPQTEIVVVGTRVGGDAPIHDRWIISEKGGLRLGSSLNGLGASRTCEISVLEEHEAIECEDEIDRYLVKRVREQAGRPLIYSSFTF